MDVCVQTKAEKSIGLLGKLDLVDGTESPYQWHRLAEKLPVQYTDTWRENRSLLRLQFVPVLATEHTAILMDNAHRSKTNQISKNPFHNNASTANC
jgi:hypothetical protein